MQAEQPAHKARLIDGKKHATDIKREVREAVDARLADGKRAPAWPW